MNDQLPDAGTYGRSREIGRPNDRAFAPPPARGGDRGCYAPSLRREHHGEHTKDMTQPTQQVPPFATDRCMFRSACAVRPYRDRVAIREGVACRFGRGGGACRTAIAVPAADAIPHCHQRRPRRSFRRYRPDLLRLNRRRPDDRTDARSDRRGAPAAGADRAR